MTPCKCQKSAATYSIFSLGCRQCREVRRTSFIYTVFQKVFWNGLTALAALTVQHLQIWRHFDGTSASPSGGEATFKIGVCERGKCFTRAREAIGHVV
jgi:hypothetical protein